MSALDLTSWRRRLLIVFALALLTRVTFIATQQDGFYFPDSLLYSQAAVRLLSVGEFGEDFRLAPGYPIFLAGLYFLFGDSILIPRIVDSLLGAFLAVLMALLGKRVGGGSVGILAGLMWAVYPIGIFLAGLVYPTGVATFLLACAVYNVLPKNQEEFSAKRIFAGGLCLGFAALTIPVVLLTIVAVAAWVFCSRRRSRYALASLFVLGTAVSLGPWTARNVLVHGRLIPVQSNLDRHLPEFVISADDSESESDSQIVNRRPSDFYARSIKYARYFGRNFVCFWELYPNWIAMGDQGYRDYLHGQDSRIVKETLYTPNRLINAVSILSTGPVFLFALFGTVAMWLKRDRRSDLSVLWIVTLSFAVGHAFFWGKMRYRIPVEPYLIILAAYGVHAAYAIVPTRFKWVLGSSRPIIFPRST